MQIEYLADHPALVAQLARLHQDQWGSLRPDKSVEQRAEQLRTACGHGDIPTVLVALESGALCGSAMLIANDMDTRPELMPWLAGVYVIADRRGRGLGTSLVRRVEGVAAALGVPRLYLHTPDAAAFYASLGWTVEETCRYLGHDVTLMSKRLVPPCAPAGAVG